jgi:hypothetical protein
MRRSSILTAALAAVAFLPAAPAESATCGKSYNNRAHPKCVKVIGAALPVQNAAGKTVCHFSKGRKFNAPRGAGTEDGSQWYSVKLASGLRYWSELRTNSSGRRVMAIKGC